MMSVMGKCNCYTISTPYNYNGRIRKKNYPGVVRMKLSECSYFWWPFLDEIIGNSGTQYNSCQGT